jgi:serine/threonine protein phosphatase PrpC
VLASDGLWDVVTNNHATSIALNQNRVEKEEIMVEDNYIYGSCIKCKTKAQALRDYAFNHASKDNISVLVIAMPEIREKYQKGDAGYTQAVWQLAHLKD